MFKLTSSIGDFVFVSGTRTSHAKLIRDTVMGEVNNPESRVKLTNGTQAREYFKNKFPQTLGLVKFSFRPIA